MDTFTTTQITIAIIALPISFIVSQIIIAIAKKIRNRRYTKNLIKSAAFCKKD